ncbi:variant erythrocyte surface antigen-1 family protein [Babesia caballi]|uniref:Variant erythrocyte surface antigen-1 family protein n=1 Tax=Babesia caballi TaxID=5871 RepID=A0AAV4LNK8_BABCB|nr:variant erythrocyte surface antigen-1 family protein [Babesia caballi]
MAAGGGKSLTDCPSNLKEAIDWILRVTGKDGGNGGSGQDGTQQLAGAVEKLLDGVQSSSTELKEKLSEITKALYSGTNNGIINALADGLKKFKEGIKSQSYNDNVYQALTQSNLNDAPNAAQIFLGCVPMIFSALSYLYWRCHGKGAWKDMKLNDGDGSALKNFMESGGFNPANQLDTRKNGGQVVTSAFGGFSSEFSSAVSAANEKGFPGFLSALLKNVTTHSASVTPGKAFVGLHIAAQAYFTHKRSTNSHASSHPPSSVRTMLYWLSGLTITPQFGELLDHINSMFPSGPMPVAISGSLQTGETLSADDVAGHFVESCVTASRVVSTIQGRSVSGNPLLHDIYCSSEFLYPSSPSVLLSKLADYAYALQFQLHFLYQQCSRVSTYGGRWRQCKYGQSINKDPKGPIVESHICIVKCGKGGHNPSSHPNNCNHEKCGESPNLSPLQAFLTDKLSGFSLSDKPDTNSPNHLENHSPSLHCHVPMGFSDTTLREKAGKGGNIYKTLETFCGSPTSPLRQLSEKLGCLTKRTPIMLGDLFGFYLQLIEQLFSNRFTMESLVAVVVQSLKTSSQSQSFKNDPYADLEYIDAEVVKRGSQLAPPSGLAKSLLTIYKDLPFWFQLFMVDGSKDIAGALFDLRQHCHNQQNRITQHISPDNKTPCSHNSGNAADLWSLYYPTCANESCGKYLSPLCYSTASTFAPKFAVTYLSWVLHLGDDLQSGFQEILDEFNYINCTSNAKEQHQINGNCNCASVVQCAGVLSLFYAYGFTFTEAEALNGWTYRGEWQYNSGSTKTCAKFSQQLSNVLAENAPLHNLLLAIDEFLYYVRFRFMSMVSSFWLSSLLILLYFIFYGIDVLHFKSHVRFPSSHIMPPMGLLSTGKAPALTKLTYYMP